MPPRYCENRAVHPMGLPAALLMREADKLMTVSARADEYQYKKTSPFFKYIPMKIRKEKANRMAAVPRTPSRKIVGPTP